MDLGKKDEKGKPHDNFGNEDGKVDKAVQDSPIFITVFVKGERRGRAENGGHRRGNESDDECIGQRLRYMAVIKKLDVPFESEACPHRVHAGVVEGVQSQDKNRQVKEGQHCQSVRKKEMATPCFLHRCLLSAPELPDSTGK